MFRFIYLLFIFLCVLMFVDAHMCMSHMCVCVCVFGTHICIYLWQPEMTLDIVPLVLYTLFF